jgi:SAM-dependent methyltransferase
VEKLSRLVRRLRRWSQVKGIQYQCPMCKFYLARFTPYGVANPLFEAKQVVGGGFRDQARCFVCGSLDRERLIYMYLKHHTRFLKTPSTILHFAPETMLSNALKSVKSHNYISADIEDERADIMIDMTNIPFDENYFDLIVANHILEHIPDDKKALSELHRVLKVNGGEAILQVPISLNSKLTYEDPDINTEADRLKAFGQKDHVRIYGQDYQERLSRSGFHVRVFDWKSCSKLNPKGKNKFGLIENEKVFVVKLGS